MNFLENNLPQDNLPGGQGEDQLWRQVILERKAKAFAELVLRKRRLNPAEEPLLHKALVTYFLKRSNQCCA